MLLHSDRGNTPTLQCQIYTLYRMNFGTLNPRLTVAINRVASESDRVKFLEHANTAMEDDGFDQLDVLACLRKGKAFGPESQNGRLRANVVHRGLHIRVAVGGLEAADGDWTTLKSVTVVTVMRSD
jgi:hypothetical protein